MAASDVSKGRSFYRATMKSVAALSDAYAGLLLPNVFSPLPYNRQDGKDHFTSHLQRKKVYARYLLPSTKKNKIAMLL